MTYDGTFVYYYDVENRLTEVNDTGGQRVATYKYDFAGRRVAKTVSGSTTTYTYDGDQIIAHYDGNGTLLRKFVFGPGIDEPLYMVVGINSYYYFFDGLGSVIALAPANQKPEEIYSYDVFGEPNRVSGVGNPYMFTGREYDVETGNYYYRARYYKPSIGRFLQPDPIGYQYSMNLYEYCWNNPQNWIDPWGLVGSWIGPGPAPPGFYPPSGDKSCPNNLYDLWPDDFMLMPGLPPNRLPPKLPDPRQKIPPTVPSVKDPGYPTPIPGKPIPQPQERETWWSLILQIIDDMMGTGFIIIVPSTQMEILFPDPQYPPKQRQQPYAYYKENKDSISDIQIYQYC